MCSGDSNSNTAQRTPNCRTYCVPLENPRVHSKDYEHIKRISHSLTVKVPVAIRCPLMDFARTSWGYMATLCVKN